MIVRGCLCLVAKKMRSYAQIENYHVNYNKNYVYKFIIFLQTKHQLKIFAKYIFLPNHTSARVRNRKVKHLTATVSLIGQESRPPCLQCSRAHSILTVTDSVRNSQLRSLPSY